MTPASKVLTPPCLCENPKSLTTPWARQIKNADTAVELRSPQHGLIQGICGTFCLTPLGEFESRRTERKKLVTVRTQGNRTGCASVGQMRDGTGVQIQGPTPGSSAGSGAGSGAGSSAWSSARSSAGSGAGSGAGFNTRVWCRVCSAGSSAGSSAGVW